jgi:hypothetical protein
MGCQRNDRILSRVRVLDDEEPLCRTRRNEDQAYRFTWNGSVDRDGWCAGPWQIKQKVARERPRIG